ncbi:tRNA uridine-5-carboxymethylaminomethyl(34) synthesis GTPase MnmE [Helicobacter trogontum]|uniref:tRNA uridine-5-carboxymethylaminomethyl(34) synthesis GTPase MnmE n=1 Tax=Helicobacter trogontum TaxID=50960 RepID=UPI000CF1C5E8|nr:tRNA uridine-5-carboxymethylaminomethyl(34) synthesis GTPase MnmE [Helicobacter trogontum]
MNTIVAISTALAKSAISIIRLSGNEALSIAAKLLLKENRELSGSEQDNNVLENLFAPRVATLRNIYNEKGAMLDKAIVIYFKAPKSFTGEDIVEIQSHGGILVANEILRACLSFGATLAKAGEFSMRALRNDKLDLVELEATIALINNTNTNLTKLLTRNLDGKLSQMLESLRQEILHVIAQIEVNIDYSEEDLDKDTLLRSVSTLLSIQSRFQSVLNSSKHYQKLQDVKLCIIGKPNVGKSSLLNLLLMQDRAIVSDQAGTTRDTITAMLDICGNLVSLTDTAGIHTSIDSIEMQGIERSFKSARESEIILCVFDISKPMDEQDFVIMEFLEQECKDKSVLIVLNKDDLMQQNSYDFTPFQTIKLNTKDENNSTLLKEKIASFLVMNINSDTFVLTNTMQSNLLESACKNLESAQDFLTNGELELASFELHQSLQSLGAMTKPYNVEDMLDSMFSQFCVGK